MVYTIIALLFFTGALNATEPTTCLLPVKLTQEQLVAADTQIWLKNRMRSKKLLVQQELSSILPVVLINIIELYRSPYTDLQKTVLLTNLAHGHGDPQTNQPIAISILLRHNKQGNYELHYKDIFVAYNKVLKRSPCLSEWIDDIHDQDMKKRFEIFLSQFTVYNVHQALSPIPALVRLPNLDHFPLAVYFGYEEKPRTRIKSERLAFGAFHTVYKGVSEACRDILEEHNKLNADLGRIFCAHCNGRIESVVSSCILLLTPTGWPSNPSKYCNGTHTLCRTLRPLRVFQK